MENTDAGYSARLRLRWRIEGRVIFGSLGRIKGIPQWSLRSGGDYRFAGQILGAVDGIQTHTGGG